ncbi:MAG: hydroxymethylbilane synthase [Planctomycetia bacterium]|nr:hydroxymethylbilane synthase [Planctomycetia bacterium]
MTQPSSGTRRPSAKLRVGTRASALARWQAEWIAAQLAQQGTEVELVEITTAGDRRQHGPIEAIGSRGVFTKEIQRALVDGRVDLAVHSLKDLSTEAVPGLCLAAVPERGPAADVLVCRKADGLDALGEKAVVGTGSPRRKSQLWHVRPDLDIQGIRGNVETRVAKLDAGGYDAIVLAGAGLARLGLADRITEVLPPSILLPAVGQGALGLETREDDAWARAAVAPLDHPATHAAVLAERTMLAALEGGCLAPIGAWARMENDVLALTGRVLSLDGRTRLDSTLTGDPEGPEALAHRVAEALLNQGAGDLIRAARER